MNLLNYRDYCEELVKNETKNEFYFYFFLALIIFLNVVYYFKLYRKNKSFAKKRILILIFFLFIVFFIYKIIGDTFFTPFIPAFALLPFIYIDNKKTK